MGRTTTPVPASLRRGRTDDIPALLAIEAACFTHDRLSRRNFRWMLTRAHAALTVAETTDGVLGYSLVLFHAGTSLGRLYSLAVLPEARRRRLGTGLLEAAEAAALEEGCVALRAELGPDDRSAAGFLEHAGYSGLDALPGQPAARTEALRYEKELTVASDGTRLQVPFHRQGTDFTCGPASLMMAMRAIDPGIALDLSTELALWREATTIFMTTGHGGCGPFGLALAAWRRGFGADIWVSEEGPLFVRTVRDERKKAVLRLVHEDFSEQVAATGIRVHHGVPGTARLVEAIEHGAVPLVLISQFRMNREKSPHWVVATGFDAHFIHVHDPDVDETFHKTATDCINIPFRRRDFDRMARFGRVGLRAAVIVYPRGRPPGGEGG